MDCPTTGLTLAIGNALCARRLRSCVMAVGWILCCTTTLAAEIRVGISGCTLKDAIRAANDDAARGSCPTGNGYDTIRLPGTAVQAPSSALPVIRTSLTIRGDANGAVISGSNQHRVLEIDSGAVVLLENLSLEDGEVSGAGSRGGAGLLIDGSDVTLRNVSVTQNEIEGGVLQGGGVRALNSVLHIEDSLFEVNKIARNWPIGGSRGGNIAVIGGQATIVRSTIRGYPFEDAAFQYLTSSGAQRGAGIWADGAQIHIVDSLFYNHISETDKGADLAATGSDVEIVNSTFARGEAQMSRIWRDAGSELRLFNTTVWASTQAAGFAGDGDLFLYNTLLVGYGIASMCEFEDGVGSVIENINSVAPDDSCFGPGTSAQFVNTWVNLLSNNGGLTPTVRLRAPSINLPVNPAVNGGDPATCTDFDQRGVDRGVACDIGAYELDDKADLFAELTLMTAPPYYLGQTLTWRALVGNLGPADVTGASLIFSLSGATLQNSSGSADCTGLSCRIERINLGGTATLMLNAIKDGQSTFDAGLVVNTVTDYSQDLHPDNNTDNANNGGNLGPAADLAVRHMLTTPGPWAIGQSVQFSIEVKNHGPNGATNVDISNALVGLSNYAVSGCSTFSAGVCRINYIGPTITRTLTASAKITAAFIRSQPSVSALEYDPDADNNQHTIRFTPATKSDVSVLMRMHPGPPYYPLQQLSWDVEVSNAGPDPATNVTIDPQIANALLTSGGTLCPSFPCVLPTIGVGATLTATWGGGTNAPGAFSNRVTVSADQTDPNLANNVIENAAVTQPASDPAANTSLVTPPSYYVGNTIEFSAQVYNGGPSLSGLIVVEFESKHLEILNVQSPSCATTNCVLQPLEVGLANGETFLVTARILQPGTFSLSTRAIGSGYDVSPGDNIGTASGVATIHPNGDIIFMDGFE